MLHLYRSTFDGEIISASSWKDSISIAKDLSGLKPLLPEGVDLEKNPDLISWAANAAAVNLVNKNDDCVSTKTAIYLAEGMANKYVNIEHKKEKVVGHIITAGFSSFEDSQILSREEIEDTLDVFNMCGGGVIYRSVNQGLADFVVSASDPKSKYHGAASLSWEVSFNGYDIMLGSKYVKDAEIISDPKAKKELSKYLRKYGGSGMTDKNEPVYRLINGKPIFLGVGVVNRPAGNVKSILAINNEKSSATISLSTLLSKKCVKPNNVTNIKHMDIEQTIEEMAANVKLLVSENKSEEAQASMRKTLEAAMKEANKEYIAERDKARAEKEASEARYVELSAQMEKVSCKIMENERKMYEMEEQSRAAKTMIRYNERMAAMDEEFDMDDEDRSIVASKVKSLDEKDESFAAFIDEMNKLWKHKNKVAKASFEEARKKEIDEEVEKKLAELSTASQVKEGEEGKAVDDALDKAVASEKGVIPNNNEGASSNPSFAERFAKAFKVKISQH